MEKIKKNAVLCLFAFCFACYIFGMIDASTFLKGKPYNVSSDDLSICNEEKAIKGNSGRIYCLYRSEDTLTTESHFGGRGRWKKIHNYYYILDNAKVEDIEKMRADSSYRPKKYYVYTFYTDKAETRRELDKLCSQWDSYMSGRTDTMPQFYAIDGCVSKKGLSKYDMQDFKNAAKELGFEESEIAPLFIADYHVGVKGLITACMSAAAIIVLMIVVIKKHRNDNGDY